MHRKWFKYLVDPENGQPLRLESPDGDSEQVVEGSFLSEATGKRYPVIGGIPRFVPRELYDEVSPIDSASTQTGRSFGDLWRTDVNRRLGENEAERISMEEQFLAMLGLCDRAEVADLFRDGMNCLNAGCGVGWSEYLFDTSPTVNRFDIDLSLAVESAYRNTRDKENVMVAQADILELPFRSDFFDVIYSNGVLHHTGDAAGAFDRLCRHLKPGGLIGIYIYNVKPLIREMADQEIRKQTTKMTFEECLEFSRSMTELGRMFQKYREPLEVTDDIPELGIKKGEYDLQKFIYDHFVKCFYNRDLGDNYSALVNVDWYHPQHATHHSRDEITSWFENNDIGNVTFTEVKGWEHSGFFVSGRKQVPVDESRTVEHVMAQESR